MFTKTLILAAAMCAGTAAAASPREGTPISATFNTVTQRYCVRATSYDRTDFAQPPIYRRTCLTERQWKARGVHFERRVAQF